jgi:ubiquitin carboxyl-terminal hydrolase L3
MSATKRWFPLESNPEIMTAYIKSLGVDTTSYVFHDVLSTDDWALEMVPSPVIGVLMLFPIKEQTETHRAQERARIEADGQIVSPKVWFTKQTVGNACGTVGLIHCLLNSPKEGGLQINPDSYIDRFGNTTTPMNPDERAVYLEQDAEIETMHVSNAQEGQSANTTSDEVDTHFVCFSHVDGHLYELDGRKSVPINHGPSSPETLLQDAVKVGMQIGI